MLEEGKPSVCCGWKDEKENENESLTAEKAAIEIHCWCWCCIGTVGKHSIPDPTARKAELNSTVAALALVEDSRLNF